MPPGTRRSAVGRFAVRSRVLLVCLIAIGGLGAIEPAEGKIAAAGNLPLIVSPASGSLTASTTTEISFLGAGASTISLRTIAVVGSKSGPHAGRLENYSDDQGVSFVPKLPFMAGETVTVHVAADVVGAKDGVFQFAIGNAVPVNGAAQHQYRTSGSGVLHFVSEPTIAPSQVNVQPTQATSSEGDFFLAPKGSVGSPGPMILNARGQLVWFHPLADPNEYAMNFSARRFEGQQVLTWWQGNIVAAHGQGEDIIMNSSYQTIAEVHAGNGFQADLHDLQLTGDTAWITTYQALHWNLTSVGGTSTGLVWDGIVQEIDVKTGLVMYEWHSLDHVPVADSYFSAAKDGNLPFDYFHINAIDVVGSDQIVVSSRNTSTAYDVSLGDGGSIRWQLGGKRSTFALGPGVRFNLQHDVRLRGNDTVTLFDNNGAPPDDGQSKALVIHLDHVTKQATLTQSIGHQPPLIGAALGNVEALPDGKDLVSWGTTHYFDEFASSGALLFEGVLATGDDSYRVFRLPWNATPATPPKLAVQPGSNGGRDVFASWNGATNVARWQVLVGSSTGKLHAIVTVKSTGFETKISIPHPPSTGVVVGRALGAKGRILGTTGPEPISNN